MTRSRLLDVLMKAALKGDEVGVIDVGSPNPLIVQVNEVFLGKPRSLWKMPINMGVIGRIPICERMYRAYSVKGLFACSLRGRLVSTLECEKCPHIRGFAEVR